MKRIGYEELDGTNAIYPGFYLPLTHMLPWIDELYIMIIKKMKRSDPFSRNAGDMFASRYLVQKGLSRVMGSLMTRDEERARLRRCLIGCLAAMGADYLAKSGNIWQNLGYQEIALSYPSISVPWLSMTGCECGGMYKYEGAKERRGEGRAEIGLTSSLAVPTKCQGVTCPVAPNQRVKPELVLPSSGNASRSEQLPGKLHLFPLPSCLLRLHLSRGPSGCSHNISHTA